MGERLIFFLLRKLNRVTDHRIELTLYKLDRVMEGDLDDLTIPLVNYFYKEKLQS